MKLQIHVDVREKDLIDLFKSYTEITIIEKALLIGDIIIYDDEKELIIFERKTIKYLAASIKDGRYQEQSLRLDSTELHNHNIFYIIEGSLTTLPSKYKINKQTILSSMISLCYYKGFSLLRTNSVLETCELIMQFVKKIEKMDKVGIYDLVNLNNTNESENNYINVIKREKKSNITPDNINILFLCQIPSVSTTSAKAIMEHFGTMYNLTNALLENKECLKDMTYMCGKKERKISKKVIENITNYLCK